jgi:hypothetical protein
MVADAPLSCSNGTRIAALRVGRTRLKYKRFFILGLDTFLPLHDGHYITLDSR